MGTVLWIIIVVIVLVVIAAFAFSVVQRRRTQQEQASSQLRKRFGPEYDRAVEEYGSPQAAEPMLRARAERVSQLNIRPLSETERTRFSDSWQKVQAQFVDDPPGAVRDADSLVGRAMKARGYPVGDFAQQASNISVEHPQVVENYRAAHGIALRQEEGLANTEDLRQAMVHYRALFTELLEAPPGEDV